MYMYIYTYVCKDIAYYMILARFDHIWCCLLVEKHGHKNEAPSQLDWKQYGHLGGLQLGHELLTQCHLGL